MSVVVVKDLHRTIKLFEGAAKRKEDVYYRAVFTEGQLIMTASQREVPVRYGNLKNSKFFDVEKRLHQHIVNMGYTSFYAIYVHEMNKNYRTGKWKYLEDPLRAAVPGFRRRVEARVKRG